MANCSVWNNWAKFSSGGIQFQGGMSSRATLTILSTKFTNNTAKQGDAGAVYAGSMTNLRLEQSTFLENWAGDNAGALKVSPSSVVSIANSIFHRNGAALGNGGAVDASGSQLDIIASNFTENRAMADGGAVHAEDNCNIDVRGATLFDGNTALLARGGAISLVLSSMQSDEGALTFSFNVARLGGAISVDEESSLRIYAGCQATNFSMNWADSPQSSSNGLWAVVRRISETTHLETSSLKDSRSEWLFLEPTLRADTSVLFCLSHGEYEIIGSEGTTCDSGWRGGYIQATDRSGTELATLALEKGDGCAASVSLSISADGILTSSTGPVLFQQNNATGEAMGFCGNGCGGALYVGTVRVFAK